MEPIDLPPAELIEEQETRIPPTPATSYPTDDPNAPLVEQLTVAPAPDEPSAFNVDFGFPSSITVQPANDEPASIQFAVPTPFPIPIGISLNVPVATNSNTGPASDEPNTFGTDATGGLPPPDEPQSFPGVESRHPMLPISDWDQNHAADHTALGPPDSSINGPAPDEPLETIPQVIDSSPRLTGGPAPYEPHQTIAQYVAGSTEDGSSGVRTSDDACLPDPGSISLEEIKNEIQHLRQRTTASSYPERADELERLLMLEHEMGQRILGLVFNPISELHSRAEQRLAAHPNESYPEREADEKIVSAVEQAIEQQQAVLDDKIEGVIETIADELNDVDKFWKRVDREKLYEAYLEVMRFGPGAEVSFMQKLAERNYEFDPKVDPYPRYQTYLDAFFGELRRDGHENFVAKIEALFDAASANTQAPPALENSPDAQDSRGPNPDASGGYYIYPPGGTDRQPVWVQNPPIRYPTLALMQLGIAQFTPLGDAAGLLEVLKGEDAYGRDLSWWEYVINLLPLVGATGSNVFAEAAKDIENVVDAVKATAELTAELTDDLSKEDARQDR